VTAADAETLERNRFKVMVKSTYSNALRFIYMIEKSLMNRALGQSARKMRTAIIV